ncbi:MAG: aminotransferase class I/II-fold pyridoxal phosphate-dependent enzyme [Verrucomicrobiota bacterium]
MTRPPSSSETTQGLPHGFIARHVEGIPRSGIRDFFEIVQSMSDVISLGIGEPDFVTPWTIREAAIYGLEKGRTGYTSNLGLPKLRKAIAGYVEDNYGVTYDHATEIMVTVGVSQALDTAIRAVTNPGDEVLYHEPCYVSYAPGVALAHGVPVALPTRLEDEFKLRPEVLEAALTPRSKALILNYPTNPTGGVMTRAELEPIAELCRRHNLVVLTDEIYSELTYTGDGGAKHHASIAALPGMRERTIFLHGFSKAYAMTGFRIGYAAAPAALTEAMMRIHQYSMLCASITGQEAAYEALENGQEEMARMREKYRQRRNLIVSSFNQMGLPCFEPRGAFYVFPDIRPSGLHSREFAVRLLEEEKVAVVPGDAFGPSGEGCVRCSYATSYEQIQIAMERIARFLDRTRRG